MRAEGVVPSGLPGVRNVAPVVRGALAAVNFEDGSTEVSLVALAALLAAPSIKTGTHLRETPRKGRRAAWQRFACARRRCPPSGALAREKGLRAAASSLPAQAGTVLKSCRLWRPAPGGEAAQGVVLNCRRRILPTLLLGNSSRNSMYLGRL